MKFKWFIFHYKLNWLNLVFYLFKSIHSGTDLIVGDELGVEENDNTFFTIFVSTLYN